MIKGRLQALFQAIAGFWPRGCSAAARPADADDRLSCSGSRTRGGGEPRTDWLDDVIERDRRGFVLTGPDLLVERNRPQGWELDRDPYFLEASVPVCSPRVTCGPTR